MQRTVHQDRLGRWLRVAAGLVAGWGLIAGGCQEPAPAPTPSPTAVTVPAVEHRYPSIFQAWSGIENMPDADELTLLAKHDLVFTSPWTLRLLWMATPEEPWTGPATDLIGIDGTRPDRELKVAHERREALRKLNPRLKLLCEVRYREMFYVPPGGKGGPGVSDALPPDSPFWLHDKDGELCPGWGEDRNHDGQITRDEVKFMLVDFRNKEFQQLLADKALAVKQSGVFDGIMLDWWNEDNATTGHFPDWKSTYLTAAEEREARLAILRATRQAVGDDFLILVNSNERTVPKSAPYVNGLFMECWKTPYTAGYALDRIEQMEKTLTWAEGNLKPPHINCLEGWREVTAYAGDLPTRVEERNSSRNQQWMRMITALSLTHSNGYVCFGDDNAMPSPDHLHNWYAFWDADLGQPVGKPVERYHGTAGLFVREFEHGYAVYNRSGAAQTVKFAVETKGVNSGAVGVEHTVPDMDGEILLKTTP